MVCYRSPLSATRREYLKSFGAHFDVTSYLFSIRKSRNQGIARRSNYTVRKSVFRKK